jgi:hypothetical protein
MRVMALSRQFDCDFSFYARWISSAIADLFLLFCPAR